LSGCSKLYHFSALTLRRDAKAKIIVSMIKRFIWGAKIRKKYRRKKEIAFLFILSLTKNLFSLEEKYLSLKDFLCSRALDICFRPLDSSLQPLDRCFRPLNIKFH
jgi:hypothetical protein